MSKQTFEAKKLTDNSDMILHRAFENKEIIMENGSILINKDVSNATKKAIENLSGHKMDFPKMGPIDGSKKGKDWFPEIGPFDGSKEAKDWLKEQLLRRNRKKALNNINNLYHQLGGYSSPLGLALGQMKPKDGGGYEMKFRGGSIDTDENGNAYGIRTLRAEIWFVGLQCVLKQEVEDEVYGSITALMPSFGGSTVNIFPDNNNTFNFRHDGERIVNLATKIYDGPPADLIITGNLKEKDNSAEIVMYKQKVQEWASKAAAAFGGAMGPAAESMSSDQGFIKDITNMLFDIVANILGMNDDVYTPQTITIFADDIISNNYGHHTRSFKNRSVNFTHAFDLSGFDDGNDRGIYTFFLDLRVTNVQDRL